MPTQFIIEYPCGCAYVNYDILSRYSEDEGGGLCDTHRALLERFVKILTPLPRRLTALEHEILAMPCHGLVVDVNDVDQTILFKAWDSSLVIKYPFSKVIGEKVLGAMVGITNPGTSWTRIERLIP